MAYRFWHTGDAVYHLAEDREVAEAKKLRFEASELNFDFGKWRRQKRHGCCCAAMSLRARRPLSTAVLFSEPWLPALDSPAQRSWNSTGEQRERELFWLWCKAIFSSVLTHLKLQCSKEKKAAKVCSNFMKLRRGGFYQRVFSFVFQGRRNLCLLSSLPEPLLYIITFF